jgi:hypothetical protein
VTLRDEILQISEASVRDFGISLQTQRSSQSQQGASSAETAATSVPFPKLKIFGHFSEAQLQPIKMLENYHA